MNKYKVTKILIIISVVIMIVGIITGLLVSSELINNGMPKENIYVDGTDFTALSEAFTYMGSTILGIIVGIYFAIIILIIWAIYGIILLIIKIINKIKEKMQSKRLRSQ